MKFKIKYEKEKPRHCLAGNNAESGREIAVKKNTVVYIIWAVWYLICLFLCLGKTPVGMAKVPFVIVGALFYVPAFCLLAQREKKTTKLLRIISICALVAFMVMFMLNVMSVRWSVTAGRVLNFLFNLFCAPINCIQSWVAGLFLWACVLMVTVLYPGRK